MNPTRFNEGKWIGHRRSQLSGSSNVRLPTYAHKREKLRKEDPGKRFSTLNTVTLKTENCTSLAFITPLFICKLFIVHLRTQ